MNKKYYAVDEVIAACIKKGVSHDIAHYTREGVIQPLVYIASLPGYAQKLLNGKAVVIGHGQLSAYWNIGSPLIAMIDSIFSDQSTQLGTKESFEMCKIYQEELHEAKLLCWRTQPPSFFNKFPHDMLALQNTCNMSDIWRFVLEQRPDVARKHLFIKHDELMSLFEFIHNEEDSFSKLHPQPRSHKPQKPVQTRTHALRTLIAEVYNDSKDKSAMAVWKAIYNKKDSYEVIQEMNRWTDVNATIRWISHRGKERSMERSTFENYISTL